MNATFKKIIEQEQNDDDIVYLKRMELNSILVSLEREQSPNLEIMSSKIYELLHNYLTTVALISEPYIQLKVSDIKNNLSVYQLFPDWLSVIEE